MSRWNPWLGAALMIAIPALRTQAQSNDPKVEELQQRVDELDRRLNEMKDEESAKQARNAASVTADTSGFKVKSNDGDFLLKIGADLQADDRTFVGDGAAAGADTILLRRVRPTFSGTVYRYIDYYFRPDFGLGTTVIYDAYLELTYFGPAKLRVGKFKPPVGLERLQSDDDTSFVERGLPTLLAPSRDIGYQVSGDVLAGRVNYSAGAFNGVPDNALSDAAVSSHRDYAARLFLTPFRGETGSPLRGLGFGSGISGGGVDGLPLPIYKTFGQTTFFPFATGVTEAGHRTRLSPQGYYYLGPFGVLAEYTLTEEGLKRGSVQRDIAFRAWQVAASYILTGESKGFTSPAPKRSFDPHNHGWGALELAARVGDFSAEKGVYEYGFASAAATPRHAHEWVGGVNWYLNRLVRVSVDYGNTNFGGGATAGNRLPERALLTRFQINFI